jgi:hypothetical protein
MPGAVLAVEADAAAARAEIAESLRDVRHNAGSRERAAHSRMTAGRSPPVCFMTSAALSGPPCRVLSTGRAHSPQLFAQSRFSRLA